MLREALRYAAVTMAGRSQRVRVRVRVRKRNPSAQLGNPTGFE
jgi:hypothetical protein